MKTFAPIVITIVLACALQAFGQVEITPNTVTYQRTGEDVPEHKKTFEVRYPVVAGITSKDVKANLANTLSYWHTFGMTLEENLGDYHWLTNLDYKVNYNKNDLLDIELIMEGSGAYPDGTVKTKVVDLETGKRLYIADVFTDIAELVLKIDKAQQAEIKEARIEAAKEGLDYVDSFDTLIGDKRFMVSKLEEFSISDEGVVFLHDYGFPHAVQALQPDGRYEFSWSEMKPHIKMNGRLSGFAK